jgi:bifunctional DNA-binding transcriptional regulator/antitoxin component of YhaV-PrlF toxin-antitoxin module
MNTIRFVKSFSKGQITIPIDIREEFGMGNDFWLKLYTQEGKIVAEPVEGDKNKTAWKKKLLKIGPIAIDAEEIRKNRDNVEKQISSRSL